MSHKSYIELMLSFGVVYVIFFLYLCIVYVVYCEVQRKYLFLSLINWSYGE